MSELKDKHTHMYVALRAREQRTKRKACLRGIRVACSEEFPEDRGGHGLNVLEGGGKPAHGRDSGPERCVLARGG